MVRDRLPELQRKSFNNGNNTSEHQHSIEMEEKDLKNTFQVAEFIIQDLEKIATNTEQCHYIMKQIRESPFKEQECSLKITAMFKTNADLIQKIKLNLNKLQQIVEKSDTASAEGRIKMIQFNSLKTRFKEYLSKNNDEMENFKNLKIKRYKAQLRAKGVDPTDDEFQSLLEDSTNNVQIFTDNHLIETAEARRLLLEAEELNQELLKIEKMLTEIRDLFVQTAVLVEDQQDLINVIEYQALQTVEYVSKTPAIIESASKKKKKAAKLKYLCWGILSIVILLMMLSFLS